MAHAGTHDAAYNGNLINFGMSCCDPTGLHALHGGCHPTTTTVRVQLQLRQLLQAQHGIPVDNLILPKAGTCALLIKQV